MDAIIRAAAFEAGRPLRMLVDLSACPRYYAVGLLGAYITQGLVGSLTVFYAEGLYPEPGNGEELVFTGSRWKSVEAPYFPGFWDPRKKTFYLVSVGFEGDKTLRTISRADPDRVSILFPEPGICPEYVEKTQHANADLVRMYRIPENQIVRAHAADAIAAWQALSRAAIERPDENAYFVCCGTKPHSIALGLRAKVLKTPAVLYNLPDEHRVVDIKPSGKFWKYEITDLTTL
jgi:hypothetical protein